MEIQNVASIFGDRNPCFHWDSPIQRRSTDQFALFCRANLPRYKLICVIALSRGGCPVSAIQTPLSYGKLFATRIDLLSGKSEGSYLLDQFAKNVQTDRFQPQNEIVPVDLKAVLASLRKQWTNSSLQAVQRLNAGPMSNEGF